MVTKAHLVCSQLLGQKANLLRTHGAWSIGMDESGTIALLRHPTRALLAAGARPLPNITLKFSKSQIEISGIFTDNGPTSGWDFDRRD